MVASIKTNNRGGKMSKQNKKITLKGIAASPGIAKGNVKVLLSLTDMLKMQEGNILVAPLTSPQLISAILQASAIVTEIGGTLSHAAIISREAGIPCIVGAKDATKILRDNMEVIVNGNKGIIFQENS